MYNEKSLLFRNFPPDFQENDITEFLSMFDAMNIKPFLPQRMAIADFKNEQHARDILKLLHQITLDGRLLYVEYAPRNFHESLLPTIENAPSNDINESVSYSNVNVDQLHINESLKRLYATADGLDFSQPPPPYLYYEYPLINRNIVDSICIALEFSEKFYTQVLHLMNRMNLEPPFVPGDPNLKYAKRDNLPTTVPQRSSSTQTDEIAWQNFLRNKRKFLASDESELESSDSDAAIENNKKAKLEANVQRKKTDRSKLKQSHSKRLKMQKLQQEILQQKPGNCATVNLGDAFDLSKNLTKSMSITIMPPSQLKAAENPRLEETEIPIAPSRQSDKERPETALNNIVGSLGSFMSTEPLNKAENASSSTSGLIQQPSLPTIQLLNTAELNENRIPNDQLKTHPLFQNYDPGEITNRLYIKNIAKDVTEDDLKAIYYRYLEQNCGGIGNIRSIDVRLMKAGRMKGQAFVTFSGPYLDMDDTSESETDARKKYQMVERALLETNGYILKNKALVVTYGKKR